MSVVKLNSLGVDVVLHLRCGNVASILELDEYLGQEYKVFSHAPLVRFYTLVLSHDLIGVSGCAVGASEATAC